MPRSITYCMSVGLSSNGRSGVRPRQSMGALLDDPEEFVDRRLALDHLAEAVFLEVDHPVLAGLGLDGVDRRVLADQVAHLLGEDEQLEDPGAPEVSGPPADGADLLGLLGRSV